MSIIYDLYNRKSEEPDDRQILSIPAQERECGEKFPDLTFAHIERESRSAKTPGRPAFNAMLDRVERGEVQGIVAYHPNRLSRNSVDGGRVIYLLDTGKLKDLKFATYNFENTPEGKWMLSMILSQAKYEVDKLSVEVKRGNRQKYEQGGISWPGPQGYMDDFANHKIVPDPERFDLVRRMWLMLLSGVYSVAEILRIANDDWGYRTRRRGTKQGGRKLAMASLYRIFHSPIYAGFNLRPDGKVYQTNHPKMITPEEFWLAQKMLGRKGRSKPRMGREPGYTDGLMRCGECGCSITVERKNKLLKNGKTLYFEHYRCTKKRGPCGQRYLPLKDLVEQAGDHLKSVNIGPHCLSWTMRYLRQRADAEADQEAGIEQSQIRTRETVEAELRTLSVMLRKGYVAESEFLKQRAELMAELGKSTEAGTQDLEPEWLGPALELLEFCYACWYRFWRGDTRERRSLLRRIGGSDLTVMDKKLHFQPVGAFGIVSRRAEYATWSGFAEDIRTYFIDHPDKSQSSNGEESAIARVA